jgi:hypothetical protein
MKNIVIGLLVMFSFLLLACAGENVEVKSKKSDKQEKKATETEVKREQPADVSSGQCDPELWKHVYNPERLEVIEQCKVVTGVIEELDENEDGDTLMLLKLDPGQDDLLTKKNMSKKNGDLVVEVVCAHDVQDKKAKEACKDFSSTVTLPKVGDHVRVTGSYVNDSHNGWTEIHPATKIEKIPQ